MNHNNVTAFVKKVRVYYNFYNQAMPVGLCFFSTVSL